MSGHGQHLDREAAGEEAGVVAAEPGRARRAAAARLDVARPGTARARRRRGRREGWPTADRHHVGRHRRAARLALRACTGRSARQARPPWCGGAGRGSRARSARPRGPRARRPAASATSRAARRSRCAGAGRRGRSARGHHLVGLRGPAQVVQARGELEPRGDLVLRRVGRPQRLLGAGDSRSTEWPVTTPRPRARPGSRAARRRRRCSRASSQRLRARPVAAVGVHPDVVLQPEGRQQPRAQTDVLDVLEALLDHRDGVRVGVAHLAPVPHAR